MPEHHVSTMGYAIRPFPKHKIRVKYPLRPCSAYYSCRQMSMLFQGSALHACCGHILRNLSVPVRPTAAFLAAVILSSAICVESRALNACASAGGCSVAIFAPDWIWQGETINIMAVARNNSASDAKLAVAAACEAGAEDVFNMPQPSDVSTVVPAGGKVRLAISGIRVLPNARTGISALSIHVASGGDLARIEYPVSIIRGSLVEKGIWSILLPALVAFLWSAALLLVLPRYSERGAWKRPSAVFVPEGESHPLDTPTHERTTA